MGRLAINGARPAINNLKTDIFSWPIITTEDEDAVLSVLRAGSMSFTNISILFEREFASYLGVKYALSHCNGTASLRAAMWACGVGAGDEVIAPSAAYWASCTAALSLGAAVHFADIERNTLNINPDDIEHRIGPRTKLIIVVHTSGYPCDMDKIMDIARRHNLMVLEDVSHAQGGLYKGRYTGTIGDVAGISMMTGKSFPIGEGGMLVTNNQNIYERAISFGHYERTVKTRYNENEFIIDPELSHFAGVPLGGVKHRLNQTCAAMGRVQLKYYPARMNEIQEAMNYFWDKLEGIPGIKAHRVARASQSTMGGWYMPMGLYNSDALDGLSCSRFCDAMRAENLGNIFNGSPKLHLHPVFHEADIFNQGKPTMIAFGQRDVRQKAGSLPVTEDSDNFMFTVPWFKHCDREVIDQYVAGVIKIVENYKELL